MTTKLIDPLYAINWNRVEDPKDLEVWQRLTSNFWLPEKVPLSNDIPSWATLNDAEKTMTTRVLTGLTLLDTIQGTRGAVSLIPDVITPHEEAVLSNLVFMECMTASHDLLTPHGWKPIADVSTDDLVAQWNPETDQIEFVHPVALSSHVPEKTYLLESRKGHVRQHVSPGHRVMLQRRVPGSDEWSTEVVRADELRPRDLTSATRFLNGAPATSGGGGMSARDRMVVAIQADGSYDTWTRNSAGDFSRSGVRSGTVPARFSLSKERKISRLSALADTLGWDLAEHGTMRMAVGGAIPTRSFYLKVPAAVATDRTKRLSKYFDLSTKSAQWCQEFISELALWDGHELENGIVIYYTSDKDNADFVTAVAALAGYRSHVGVRRDERSGRFSDSYVVTVTPNRRTTSGQVVRMSELPGERVYGVEVPSTYLVTRNGHSVTITGNCVHAKSYSSIFSTLLSSDEIDEAFAWSVDNEHLQRKARTIVDHYEGDDPLKRKIASVMLESFLFYSGFYAPMYWSSRAQLTNTADLIRLIIRDEAVHGYYIGYKYQKGLERVDERRRAELKAYTYELLDELFDIEEAYTHDLYEPLGLTDDVMAFMRYNANKTLMNLGYEGLFPAELTNVNPAILAALSPNSDENHDFFSGSGSSYVIGKAEETADEDWDF